MSSRSSSSIRHKIGKHELLPFHTLLPHRLMMMTFRGTLYQYIGC